jgi:hypothetical protein
MGTSEVLISYEGEEIRCNACLQSLHSTRACPTLTKEAGAGAKAQQADPRHIPTRSQSTRKQEMGATGRRTQSQGASSSPNLPQSTDDAFIIIERRKQRRKKPKSHYHRNQRGGAKARRQQTPMCTQRTPGPEQPAQLSFHPPGR